MAWLLLIPFAPGLYYLPQWVRALDREAKEDLAIERQRQRNRHNATNTGNRSVNS